MFGFTQFVYNTEEQDGPVTVTVQLLDRMLTFPISVTIIDIFGGSASGKITYMPAWLVFINKTSSDISLLFSISKLVHEYAYCSLCMYKVKK